MNFRAAPPSIDALLEMSTHLSMELQQANQHLKDLQKAVSVFLTLLHLPICSISLCLNSDLNLVIWKGENSIVSLYFHIIASRILPADLCAY